MKRLNTKQGCTWGWGLVVLVVVAGCAKAPAGPSEAERQAAAEVLRVQQAKEAEQVAQEKATSERDMAVEALLTLATRHYDAGNYAAAVNLIAGDREMDKASLPVRLRARKLQAFARCTMGQKTVCQKDFEAILAWDPLFALSPYEAGNPNWDPVFHKAKRAAQRRKGE